jgi:hypothetical protein
VDGEPHRPIGSKVHDQLEMGGSGADGKQQNETIRPCRYTSLHIPHSKRSRDRFERTPLGVDGEKRCNKGSSEHEPAPERIADEHVLAPA